jgi:hypothetical protein
LDLVEASTKEIFGAPKIARFNDIFADLVEALIYSVEQLKAP